MKVDYADRELAPNGGALPEDFAAYLQDVCSQRESDGYQLVAVLPSGGNGNVSGAWLFFSEAAVSGDLRLNLEAAEVMPPPSFRPPGAT
jgi:hypothetical protein